VTLLLVYVAFALGVSFICSTLEASLLASRNANLAEQQARGSKGAGLLLELKRHRIDDAISAILVVNTIANTLGATMAGSQAGRVFADIWIGVFSGVLTFLILIVSEIIPKTLGTVYARQLSPIVGWTIHLMTFLMKPVLVVTGALTRMLTRGRTSGFSRAELTAIVSAARREGALSADEAEMFGNLLRFDSVTVGNVMTPRTVMFMMPESATVETLLATRRGRPFSRIPLFRANEDDVVGYVMLDDVLRFAAERGDPQRPLGQFVREIAFVPELATIGNTLRQFLRNHEHIAMVTDEHGSISGLVTMEDLTETMLGVEIIDESDRVVDLREAAARLRERRLERLRTRGLRVDWMENPEAPSRRES
jgi:CBS domain containing-hemolysin-like protein